jgi:TetR/AcrR family transcriptional repressor of nem operon
MPRTSDAKERLMDAVSKLIWTNSYGATSVDAICEKAGVKKGSFYYFFKSKSELAVAALEADWRKRKGPFDAAFSATVPPLQRLLNYFDLVYESQAAMQKECGFVLGCPMATLGSEISTQDAAIRKKVHELLSHRMKYFESAIRDANAEGLIAAPDAKRKAHMLFAFFQGVLMQARIQDSLEPLRKIKRGALELLGAKQNLPRAA